MKPIYLFLFLLCCYCPFMLKAQKITEAKDTYKYNAVYLETGGPALLYSLGYERTLIHSNRLSFLFSIAAAYIPTSEGITMFSIEPDVLFHFKKSAIEVGLAFSFGAEGGNTDWERYNSSSSAAFLAPRLGYRYSFSNKCYLRCGITPLFQVYYSVYSGDSNAHFWMNLCTFGYKF